MKNLLFAWLCLLSFSALAQDISIGFNAGGNYTIGRPVQVTGQDYRTIPQFAPSGSLRAGLGLGKWEVGIAAEAGAMRCLVFVPAYTIQHTYTETFYMPEQTYQFQMQYASTTVYGNRIIPVKVADLYVGAHLGWITGKQENSNYFMPTYRLNGFATGVQAGISKPLGKHLSANAELGLRRVVFMEYSDQWVDDVANSGGYRTYRSAHLPMSVGLKYSF